MASSSSSANKYATKLASKLSALQETSSKESLQTLAKWISFHRKHSRDLVGVLTGKSLQSKGTLTIAVINELLLLEKDKPTRWERLSDLRLAIGEQLVKAQGDLPTEKLGSLLTEWDKHNVFGGPTLIHQLRRKVSGNNASPAKQSSVAAAKVVSSEKKSEQQEAPPKTVLAKVETKIQEPEESKPKAKPKPEPKQASPAAAVSASAPPAAAAVAAASTSSKVNVVQQQQPQYDFESKNIPERTVEPREFLEPCRAIATLQIARDLRNDNAVQLSSLLQNMPEDVRAFTAQTAEQGTSGVLEEAQARDFTKRTADELIDTDLVEALQNARTLRDIVRQQSAARRQLLELLVASRCKFGAEQAALAYHEIDTSELKRRAEILSDAMELEGLDIAEEESKAKAAKDIEDEELPPLSWYKPEEESSPKKRQKVD